MGNCKFTKIRITMVEKTNKERAEELKNMFAQVKLKPVPEEFKLKEKPKPQVT